MIILVGLGNPGEKYARHRHNVGYMAVDAIAEANGFGPPRRKFHGEIREGFLAGPAGREKAVILKPQTYMNESGQSVRAAADFFKLGPKDVVVFYDEIDLAPGKLRVKTGGGAAGHNGIRSIDAHLGNDFRRVRIGVGHPGDKSKVSGYVLGDFAKADQNWLAPLLDAIAAAAPFLAADDQRFATDISQRMADLKPARPETSAGAEPKEPAAPSPAAPKTETAGPFAALKKIFHRSGD